ncbi:hypothetical protein PAAG_06311 [Paracoccidioides lutzii Pb01]|uniref:Uncharacterized protein n=1 Tax=Paracoccidioides lutzii (strain ATCC MYA-826 / Pb01) TaxID=502779 RepID=C1H6C0_PARBA|nr:hypothetical protein PAAG_06311 [Paracoccidioides lutzii Pb01]EEH35264.2 hypothetical protein PAAG_06311 [Paracoccidioides lutzii Pb01]
MVCSGDLDMKPSHHLVLGGFGYSLTRRCGRLHRPLAWSGRGCCPWGQKGTATGIWVSITYYHNYLVYEYGQTKCISLLCRRFGTNSDEDMSSCLSCERPAYYKIEPGDVRKSEITLPEPNHGLEQGGFSHF